MLRSTLAALALFIGLTAKATSYTDTAFTETPIVLHTATGDVSGTLTLPRISGKTALALIIAGSGPTDRNGNNPMMKNDCLRKLAYGLADNKIASVRFDKRGIGESKSAAKSEADLRFEDYLSDAEQWLVLLKKDNRFSKVIVIGHSEGSLIGMIAARSHTDAYISVAGAGKSADKIIKEQLSSQPQQIRDLCAPILDSLVAGKTVKDVPPMLFSLFRPSVQPYLISWFNYDPQIEIRKLDIPVLIIQGTNDIQVTADDAKLLQQSSANSKLILIKNMNHIFRLVEEDRNLNIATYGNALLPISNDLIDDIVAFIQR